MGEAKRRSRLDPSFKKFPKNRWVLYVAEIDRFWGNKTDSDGQIIGHTWVIHPGESVRFSTKKAAESMAEKMIDKIVSKRGQAGQRYAIEVCYMEDLGEKIGVTTISEYFAEIAP